jgi:hypothetical protein
MTHHKTHWLQGLINARQAILSTVRLRHIDPMVGETSEDQAMLDLLAPIDAAILERGGQLDQKFVLHQDGTVLAHGHVVDAPISDARWEQLAQPDPEINLEAWNSHRLYPI